MSAYGILVDVTKCTGCEKCVEACTTVKKEDPKKVDTDRYNAKDGLSGRKRISILPVAEGRFARKSCLHCDEPNCAAACLVGALKKDEKTGAVLYDPKKCIGCRYCMLACTFHIPRYEWEKALPYVVKCDMCVDRQAKGDKPACVEACKYNALTFGLREDLLRKAKETISKPGSKYVQRVWGETEVGGTSLLYISDVDLSALDWPSPTTPSASKLAMPVVKATPVIGATVITSLLGINWIIKRRMKLMGGEAEEGAASDDAISHED